MVAIAPSTAPSGRTHFTDADLARVRSRSTAPAPSAPPVHAAGPDDDAVRDWTDRVRDRAEDVQEAQAKARRLDAEVAALRARLGGTTDSVEREKVEDDLQGALADLERAERNVREAERRLDDTRADARRAGVTVG
jgi:hypothetical protein